MAGPWAIALAGLVALAVAMGLGRFAFTPLLPMMQLDAGLTPESDMLRELRARWQPPVPPARYPLPVMVNALAFSVAGLLGWTLAETKVNHKGESNE